MITPSGHNIYIMFKSIHVFAIKVFYLLLIKLICIHVFVFYYVSDKSQSVCKKEFCIKKANSSVRRTYVLTTDHFNSRFLPTGTHSSSGLDTVT